MGCCKQMGHPLLLLRRLLPCWAGQGSSEVAVPVCMRLRPAPTLAQPSALCPARAVHAEQPAAPFLSAAALAGVGSRQRSIAVRLDSSIWVWQCTYLLPFLLCLRLLLCQQSSCCLGCLALISCRAGGGGHF